MEVIRQENAMEDEDPESDSDDRQDRRHDRDDEHSQSHQVDVNDMKILNPNLADFTFDTKRGEWCEIVFEVKPLKFYLIF